MAHKATKEQRNKNLRSFVIATYKFIEEDNFNSIHIRSIAKNAGFHNSTIYTYFKDAEYLISLASVKFFEQYSHSPAELSDRNLSDKENFFEIWRFFCLNAFKYPEIYHNFFFGRHSDDLTSIFKEYYTIFPDEEYKHSSKTHSMYVGKNINIRCLDILKPLIGLDGNRLSEENVTIANSLIIAYFKTLLEQVLVYRKDNKEVDTDELTTQFMTTLEFIIKTD